MRCPCTFMGRGTRRLLGAGVADAERADRMAPLARGADEMGGRGRMGRMGSGRPAGRPARCPIALMGGGPGLSKAAQIARAAERGGSAKRATRQARAHATGNQNNRRQKRDGRTHGTAWNYGVPERLGQHAGCGPRRVPRPHQAAHGAGRGRHPRKGGRHHRKGRESASLADHKRDRRARRASGHAPPRLLRPLPPGDAGLPRAHCVPCCISDP